ncbi:RhoGAP domain protein [Aphelenchoides besseyi]|nr:RhoGAP domain protein [Aphelenchoides besseyi]
MNAAEKTAPARPPPPTSLRNGVESGNSRLISNGPESEVKPENGTNASRTRPVAPPRHKFPQYSQLDDSAATKPVAPPRNEKSISADISPIFTGPKGNNVPTTTTIVEETAASPTSSSADSILGELRPIPAQRSAHKLTSVLTPPLARPLFPAPPPPLRLIRKLSSDTSDDEMISERTISLHTTSEMQGVVFRDPPSQSPLHLPKQSMSLDLNKISLRYADEEVEDELDEAAERRRRQLQAASCISEYRLSELSCTSFEEEDNSAEKLDYQEQICFSGYVNMIVSNKKRRNYWLILRGNEFSFCEDDTTNIPCIGPLNMQLVRFLGLIDGVIHIIFNERSLIETPNYVEYKGLSFVEYKLIPIDNINIWMQFLTQAACQNEKVLRCNIQEANACGRFWLKQALGDEWNEGWAFITDRRLRYWIEGLDALFELDLRRATFIKRELNNEYWCPQVKKSSQGPLLITLDGSCLYIQSEFDACTTLLGTFLNSLYRSATRIEEHCLTIDSIPLLVEKCIRFVSTYGMDLKGIYRKNGSAAEARSLMNDYTNDPLNFHIMRINDETSNVAADVLRAFFRQLSEPLIPVEFHKTFYHIAALPIPDSRVEAYRATLAKFPTVNLNTIRRLITHLAEVSEHSEKNFASIENLSKIFGPTTFGLDKSQQTSDTISMDTMKNIAIQIRVIQDLLTYCKEIFPLTARETAAKEKINELQSKKSLPKARANGLLVAIHLLKKDNTPFNVQSHLQASDVVETKQKQLRSVNPNDPPAEYALFEVLANGCLQRRIAPDEVLSHIVIDRWLSWKNAFSDSYLCLRLDQKTVDAMKTNAFADDVRYAEPGSKSFKAVHFKLESGTRIVCYSKAMKPLAKWNLAQTLWFEGATEERKAPNNHTLTFFVVQGPDKSKIKNKLSGSCIAFQNLDQLTQWHNCIMICKRECET